MAVIALRRPYDFYAPFPKTAGISPLKMNTEQRPSSSSQTPTRVSEDNPPPYQPQTRAYSARDEDTLSEGQGEPEGLHDDNSDEVNVESVPMASKESVLKSGAPSNRKSQRRVLWQMIIFYLLALCFMSLHLAFFLLLHGRPVATSGFSQSLQAALANFLAIAVEICLLSGIGVAYDQFLWRLFRHKSLKAITIDKLVTLVTSPWNLLRPDLLFSAPGPWLIAFMCFSLPVAVVFPPGALTVEFQESILPVALSNVPTMNISNWGNGTARDFFRHSFLEMDVDLVAMQQQLIRPSLEQIAAQVLTSGEPVRLPSPCDGPCTYSLIFDGPKFQCEMNDPKGPSSGRIKCIEGLFSANDRSKQFNGFRYNNLFQLEWPETMNLKCVSSTTYSMNCSMLLATYNFTITNLQNGSRVINTEILDEKSIWTNSTPIQENYYNYFVNYTTESFYNPPRYLDQFSRNFSHAQAFAIRTAAVRAMEGSLALLKDTKFGVELPTLITNDGSLAAGSPYIGLQDKLDARLNVTTSGIESYLRDVVISSIALNSRGSESLWLSDAPITALLGANTYMFTEPWQFYAPYISCLVITLFIYAAGYISLRRNGVSSGNSLLQFVTTTSSSGVLRDLSQSSTSGGMENISRELKNVKLRFGVARVGEFTESQHPTDRFTLLGAQNEIEPTMRR